MLIEKRIKIGKAITSDLVQAKTSLSLTEESVITAEVNYSKALLYLQQMICPKMIYNKTRIKINPATSFDMELGQEQLTVKEKETIDLAFKHRKDLKQTNILMANSEISLEKHNSNTMPSLDVFGTVLQRKESDKINTSFVGFNSKPSWLIGLSFSTPFIDHNANSELGKAKLNRRKRELQIESVKNQIALEVKTGILDLYSAYQKMIISKKTCQYAEEQFTSEMTRFENGLSTTFIINQLRLEKSKSELSLVRSKVKYLLARLYLDKIIGVLLQSKLTIKSKM